VLSQPLEEPSLLWLRFFPFCGFLGSGLCSGDDKSRLKTGSCEKKIRFLRKKNPVENRIVRKKSG
jgi:hypothetical protein